MTLLPYRISLAALLLAVTLPFLGPHHRLPIVTFYQEWMAGMLGLVALAPLVFARNDPWTIPRTVLLPLMLTALVWIQLATGVDVLVECAVLFSLYLAWAAMLMLVASRLASGVGREVLADWLAWALLTAALLVAGTGALQRWAPWAGQPYIFPRLEVRISGNLAQANNYASYIWIGIVAALHLHGRGKLAYAPLWLALPVLMGLSLLSASRSVYVYAGVLSLWCALWAWRSEGGQRRRLAIAALLLLPVLSAMQALLSGKVPEHVVLYAVVLAMWCAGWAWRKAGNLRRRLVFAAVLVLLALLVLTILQPGIGALIANLQQSVANNIDPVRLALWRAALEIFSEHPLLGAGFNSFPHEFFLRIERFPIAMYRDPGIPEHTHNLLTQMLAEFGIAGFSLTLVAAAGWLIALRLRDGNGASHLALGILLILGIQSGLEYPLWYAYFLAIAAIALSLGDEHGWQFRSALWQRPALALAAISGMLALIHLRSDYTLLENAANGQTIEGQTLPPGTQQELLTTIYTHSLWRHYAALQLAARTPIENKDVEARLRIVKNATHFSPITQAVFRQAALLQLAGQSTEAEAQLLRAMISYPTDIPAALMQMEESKEARPVLQPLIDLLRQSMAP